MSFGAVNLYSSEHKNLSEVFVPGKWKPPEQPITCCMSGCPKCVWIIYGKELVHYYSDRGKTAMKEIDKMEDPFLKTFVKVEVMAALHK